MPLPTDEQSRREMLQLALYGAVRTGDVDVFDFDLGVVKTIGAVYQDNAFYIIDKDLPHPEEMPGVPVNFEVSDDLHREYKIPCIIVRNTGVDPDLARRKPGAQQYRVPAPDAVEIEVNGIKGWDKYEQKDQATPVNITYSVVVQARNRGGGRGGVISEAQAILRFLYRSLQPRCNIYVEDSEGGFLRGYTAFVDSYTPTQVASQALSRVIGFEIPLRVQAEIDMNPPTFHKAVISQPVIRIGAK